MFYRKVVRTVPNPTVSSPGGSGLLLWRYFEHIGVELPVRVLERRYVTEIQHSQWVRNEMFPDIICHHTVTCRQRTGTVGTYCSGLCTRRCCFRRQRRRPISTGFSARPPAPWVWPGTKLLFFVFLVGIWGHHSYAPFVSTYSKIRFWIYSCLQILTIIFVS